MLLSTGFNAGLELALPVSGSEPITEQAAEYNAMQSR
jgi:hypothetical protein